MLNNPAQLAVLGLQGGLRPLDASLAPHLPPASGSHELLEQLPALSLPGELISPVIINGLGGKPLYN